MYITLFFLRVARYVEKNNADAQLHQHYFCFYN